MKPLDRVFVSIGPFKIYWYAIFILTGVVIGLIVANRQAKKEGFEKDIIFDLIILALPVAIICARLYYVIFQWSEYSSSLIDIFKTWQGGLAIHGGLIGAFVSGYFFCKKKKISFLKLADIVAPSIIIGQILGRWGNFMNQEAFGGEVSRKFLESIKLPDFIINQMYINGAYHHPTFLYESLWNIGILVILLIMRNRKHFQGKIFFTYIAGYSVGRFLIEGLRTDSLMLTSNIRVAQFVSFLSILIAVIFLFVLSHKNKTENNIDEIHLKS